MVYGTLPVARRVPYPTAGRQWVFGWQVGPAAVLKGKVGLIHQVGQVLLFSHAQGAQGQRKDH
jgi:hypothetical protein